VRKRVYRGFDEEEIRILALERDRIIVKWIEVRPEIPATAAQRRRLAELGRDCPPEMTVREAGDLLRSLLSGDRPVGEALRARALRLKIETTPHAGRRQVFDAVFRRLCQPGREQELVAWFTYRVYRTLTADDLRVLIREPEHPVIGRIADYLLQDEAVLTAIRQYRHGRELIRFGRFIGDNGLVEIGGSMGTIAYQRAKACLELAFAQLPQIRPPKVTTPSPGQSASLPSSLNLS
jgi:hypothetical protein